MTQQPPTLTAEEIRNEVESYNDPDNAGYVLKGGFEYAQTKFIRLSDHESEIKAALNLLGDKLREAFEKEWDSKLKEIEEKMIQAYYSFNETNTTFELFWDKIQKIIEEAKHR